MKKKLIAGLAILGPIVLTFLMLRYLLNLLTAPFFWLVEAIFGYYDCCGSKLALILSQVLLVGVLILTILAIGKLGKYYLIRQGFHTLDAIALRIPGINRIYVAIQEGVNVFFRSKKPPFSQIVRIPFPVKNYESMGFIVGTDIKIADKEKMAIFIPSAINPIFGWFLLFPKNEASLLDTPLEDALKLMASGGAVQSKKEDDALPI